MIVDGVLVMALFAVVLGVIAWLRPGTAFRQGTTFAFRQFRQVILVMIVAMFLASFLTTLIPEAVVARWLGEEAGIKGILLASVIGGFVPGGPMITFPIIVALAKMGVATSSVIAFLTAWSVYAFHRIAVFEVPLIGWRITLIRFASSVLLPPLSGVLAGLLVDLSKAWGI